MSELDSPDIGADNASFDTSNAPPSVAPRNEAQQRDAIMLQQIQAANLEARRVAQQKALELAEEVKRVRPRQEYNNPGEVELPKVRNAVNNHYSAVTSGVPVAHLPTNSSAGSLPVVEPDAVESYSCTAFKLSAESSTVFKVAGGQVGSQILTESSVSKGNSHYVRITLNATTGSYTASFATSPSSNDTTQSVLIGSIDSDGIITQNYCGPIAVTVCRNWFNATLKYGMTLSF